MNFASVSFLADAPEISAPSRTPSHRRPAAPPPPAPAPTRLPDPVAESWPVAVLGVPFDPVTVGKTLSRLDAMIASRQPHYVVTANVDFLVQAHRDVELRRILVEADLVLCDGTPLLWASRWLGNALPERVAGSDLAPALIENAARKGHRIFFLGAGPGVAAAATEKLKQTHPALQIVGHYSPPFSALLEMDHVEITRQIRAARPDILLVSFGCPKQEKWIAMHYRALGVPVSIGVGATIDFLAGRVPRAPDWMRRSGTEWLYRLIQEPRRLYKRYATDLAVFGPAFVLQRTRLSGGRARDRAPRLLPAPAAQWNHVDAGDALTLAALRPTDGFWRALPLRNNHCLLDCSAVRTIDGTGVAFLLRWRKQLRAGGRQLVLLAPSRPLRRALASTRVADFFTVADTVGAALRSAEISATQPPVLHDGAARALAWCDEIVAANTEEVWRLTTEHIQSFVAEGSSLIVIDLSKLRFVDSSGAGLMLRIKKWAQQFPAEVLFARPQPNVHNVLRLTRLDGLLLEGAP